MESNFILNHTAEWRQTLMLWSFYEFLFISFILKAFEWRLIYNIINSNLTGEIFNLWFYWSCYWMEHLSSFIFIQDTWHQSLCIVNRGLKLINLKELHMTPFKKKSYFSMVVHIILARRSFWSVFLLKY